MSNNNKKLFEEFKAPTKEEWRAKIESDLAKDGADFEKRLVWRTGEGFNMQPFYRREDLKDLKTPEALPGEFPFVRGNKTEDNSWYVRQNIYANDAKEANTKALDVLNRGIDSLEFVIPGDKVSEDFVNVLLKDIYCEIVEVNFRTSLEKTHELAVLIDKHISAKGCDKSKIVGSIDWDPLRMMVMQGKDTEKYLADIKDIVKVFKDYPKFRCVTVNANRLGDNGAYVRQELGCALAWGNEYMNLLTEAGFSADEAANNIKFNLSISPVYFMEIAKFRAARMLWAEIVKKYEPASDESCKMCVNAVTTRYNMTMYDSYVNLLRSQTETMSAALAGVHSIVVTPFNVTYEEPTDFSERIARNQQLLLKEESHYDKIVDPSAGSYFIEELTTAISKEAWEVFLGIEENGGFLADAKAGKIQDAIAASNDSRHLDTAKRKEFLLGTNQFPNFTEVADGKKPMAEYLHDLDTAVTAAPYKNVKLDRMASEFEAVRMNVEGQKKTPIAFMLTIGSLAWRQARAQFSSNFLRTAGYQIIDNLGFQTVEEGVDAGLKAGADVIVLCSKDDEYAEYAPAAFKYLNNRALFVVAGAPACMDELKAQGIENFVHVKCNVLETMKDFNAKLGIK